MNQNPSKPNADRRALFAVLLHAFLVLLTFAMATSLVLSISRVAELDWRWMAHGTQTCLSLYHLGIASMFFAVPFNLLVLEVMVLGLLILDWRFCRNLIRRGAETTLGWYSCGIATVSVAALLVVLAIVGGYFRGWGKDMDAQVAFQNRNWIRSVMLRQSAECSFQGMSLKNVIAKLNENFSPPRKQIRLDASLDCGDLLLTHQPTFDNNIQLGTALDIVCTKLRDVYGVEANWGIEGEKVVVHCHRTEPAPNQSTTTLLATVQTVVPLQEFAGTAIPVHPDPRFALTVRIESATPALAGFAAGSTVTFAIHSPAKLFGETIPKGKTVSFRLSRELRIAE